MPPKAPEETIELTCPNGHRFDAPAYRSSDDGHLHLHDDDVDAKCPECGEVATS
jgi:hypothetical protein